MMLTAHDRAKIVDDVAGIIGDWVTYVDIWTPLPDEQQPGWNPIMGEVVGAVSYNKVVHMGVQRTDMALRKLDTDVGGDRYDGESILCISTKVDIDEESLFIIDGDEEHPWRVKSIKPREGENMVHIFRLPR